VGGTSRAALRRATRIGDGWIGTGQTPEQADAILGDLERGRREAGRANESFEAIVPLVVPPEGGLLRRLAARGATGTVSYPFVYTLGPASTLAQKRAYLEGFAEQVIAKLGAA
jgi:alkanesulfonate monooxygenase SsuD/methylene tetrahydromethanopterin reductase-like flavin-dependent oxidoreductase (luciferase family)